MHAAHGFWDCLEDLELLLACLLYLHDGCEVVAAVAIVRCAPDSHQVLFLNGVMLTLNQWM